MRRVAFQGAGGTRESGAAPRASVDRVSFWWWALSGDRLPLLNEASVSQNQRERQHRIHPPPRMLNLCAKLIEWCSFATEEPN